MNRLRANTLTLLASNAGSALLAFALSALIGRVLGAEGLGVYATALAWAFPLSLVAEFGLGTVMTRAVAADATLAPAYLRATTLARLLLGGGLALLLLLAAPLLSDDAAVVRGIMLSAPLVLIGPFTGAFTALFRARRIMWPVAALNLGMLIAQLALTAVVFVGGGDVIDALAVNVLTSMGQLLAANGLYQWYFGRTFSGISVALPVGPLLHQAWPFAVAAILAAFHARIGVILLERLADTGAAGVYAGAARFIEGGNLMGRAYFDALFPALAALATQPHVLEAQFRRARRFLLLVGGSLASGGLLLGPLLMRGVYAFTEGGAVLQIAALALLPGLLKGGRVLYWYARGEERFVNRVTLIALLLRLLLSVTVIPVYGALGLAAVNVAVEAVSLVLLWRPFRSKKARR